MINTINKLLLEGDKFMPEIHLRQPQFTYSACGPFTKHEQRIQKFRETGDTNYIYKNELGKACFVHDAAYSDSKDLTKRIVADKILKNKAFDIAKDPKYDGYQRGLASMVYKFFDSKVASPDKKSVGSGAIPLAKNVLATLGISAAMSAIDGSIKKKVLGSGATTLIISNDEMDDILKIVKSLENSGVLLKGVSETIQHEAKEQRGGFLNMLLGTLEASLLGDVLSKGLSGKGVIRAGEGTIRAGYGSKRPSLKNF